MFSHGNRQYYQWLVVQLWVLVDEDAPLGLAQVEDGTC
jgi:hypothetical protein